MTKRAAIGIGSIVAEGGYIHPLEKSRGAGVDRIRITDRFYLGEPQFRGFDIRGVGPRVLRAGYVRNIGRSQGETTIIGAALAWVF